MLTLSSPTVRTGMQTDRLGTTFWEWQSGHSLLWGGEGVAPFWRSWRVGWDLKVSEGRWTQAERRAHTGAWSPVGGVLWLWVWREAWLYKGPEHVGRGDLGPGWVAAHLLHQEFWGRSHWGCSQSGGLLEEEVSGCFWHLLGLLEQDPKLHLSLGWVFLSLPVMGRVWRAEKREARSWDRVIWITSWRGRVFPADLVLL